MYIKAITALLVVLKYNTIFSAIILKNLMFLSAQTQASVQNRQVSVFKSKYSRYCLSGGTMTAVAIASKNAIHITAFFLINSIVFSYIFRIPSDIITQYFCYVYIFLHRKRPTF
jgi:hypothetical protein